MPQGGASSSRTRSAYIGIACTVAGAIGFSAKTVIVKLAYRYGVDVLTLLALRMLFALPFFVAMAWWAGRPARPLTRRDWSTVAALGFIGYFVGSYLDLAGLQYISASLGRLILYLYPTIVIILSAVFFGQRIELRHVVSLALSYGGIFLVFGSELDLQAPLGDVMLGAGLVFCGAVTYAVYLVAGARIVQTLGSMRFTAYASAIASFFVLGTFGATHGVSALDVPRGLYLLTLVLAVFSTVLPLWLLAEGLRRIGANQVALVACVGPLSTIALAHVFLDEPVTSVQLVGAALVLAGIVIISLRPQDARR
jgi:drug/metabolite transporter (DMT)-like permease